MLSEPVFAWLAGGVVALLAASTVLGMILAQHVRSDAARATVAWAKAFWKSRTPAV